MRHRRALLVFSALGTFSFLSTNSVRTHMAARVVAVVLILWLLSLASSFLSTMYFYSVPAVVGYDESNLTAIASGCRADMIAGVDHESGCSSIVANLKRVFDLSTTTAEGHALQWRLSADTPGPLKPSFEQFINIRGNLGRVYPASAVSGPGAFVMDITNLDWVSVSGQVPGAALSIAHWFDEYGRPGTPDRVVLVHAPPAANESYLAVTTTAVQQDSRKPVRGRLDYYAFGKNELKAAEIRQSFCTLGAYSDRKFLYVQAKPELPPLTDSENEDWPSAFLSKVRNGTRSVKMALAPIFSETEVSLSSVPRSVVDRIDWPPSVKNMTRLRQGLCSLSEISIHAPNETDTMNIDMQPYTLEWENGFSEPDVYLRPAMMETYTSVPYTTQYYRRKPANANGGDVTRVRVAIDRAAAGVGDYPLVAVPSMLAGSTATLYYPVDALVVAIVAMIVVGACLTWFSPALRYQDIIVPRLAAHARAPVALLSEDDFDRDGFMVWDSAPSNPSQFGLVSARGAGAHGEGEQLLTADGENVSGLAGWENVHKEIKMATCVKT